MGQFTFWSYFTPPGLVELAFRIQYPPTYPLARDYYYLTYNSWQNTSAYRIDNGAPTFLGFFDYVPTPATWEHLLLLWAPSCSDHALPGLEILLMKQEPWGWHGQGYVVDTLDKWADSPVNGFAFVLRSDDPGTHCYLDDSTLEHFIP